MRVFAITIFLSAFLLFQVQLIISKHILPWFGGSAAVWTTSMLVFQTLLVAGYVYSHLVTERLSSGAQARLHISLLLAALVVLGVLSMVWPSAVTPNPVWKPAGVQHPVKDVIGITLLATGLPFFVLSTTGPLLQRWFARQGGGAQTYRLYAVSNFGSLLGLLSFPLLFEPIMRLRLQGQLWSVLFVLFCTGCGWCAWKSIGGAAEAEEATRSSAEPNGESVSALSVALWFLLSACASALLLATTNQLCQEVVSLPLLWVAPLALYLLSFILCFDHPRWYRREVFQPLFAVGVFVLCASMAYAERTAQMVSLPLLLFVSCMICHGELVRLKPGVKRLTGFYLAVAAGGALGGLFVAIVAPNIFRFFTEFPISLGACAVLMLLCLALDGRSWFYAQNFWLPCAMILGTVLLFAGLGEWIPGFGRLAEETLLYTWLLVGGALLLAGAYIQSRGKAHARRGFRFVQPIAVGLLLLAIVALYESARPEPGLFLGERNFYGALRVFELAQGGKALFHARTMHGAQLDPPNDRLPMVYYGPNSGIGLLFANHPKRNTAEGNLRVGLVGLGAGTLAAYGRPGDYFRYYEINPQVVELSEGARPVFTYLRESAAQVDIELGDARLLLEHEAASGRTQNFDLLVLDAFAGDAVPVHLLTKEAFDTYAKHLRDDRSMIAVHLSSRHLNLLPVIEGVREQQNAYTLVHFSPGSYPFLESLWVFLAKRPEALEIRGVVPSPPPEMPGGGARLWTDDYSNIFELIY
jgi:hypothetical protein